MFEGEQKNEHMAYVHHNFRIFLTVRQAKNIQIIFRRKKDEDHHQETGRL